MKKKQEFDKEAYAGDVLDLFRKIVGAPKISDLKEYDKLKGQDEIDFLRYCNQVYSDKYFPEIIKHLLFECVQKAAMEGSNMDVVLVNRATANGIQIVNDFFAKYNIRFVERYQGDKEDFDERSPFQKLGE